MNNNMVDYYNEQITAETETLEALNILKATIEEHTILEESIEFTGMKVTATEKLVSFTVDGDSFLFILDKEDNEMLDWCGN